MLANGLPLLNYFYEASNVPPKFFTIKMSTHFESNPRADNSWSRIQPIVEVIFTPAGRSITFEQYMKCYTYND